LKALYVQGPNPLGHYLNLVNCRFGKIKGEKATKKAYQQLENSKNIEIILLIIIVERGRIKKLPKHRILSFVDH
jgi:hypothetical protein